MKKANASDFLQMTLSNYEAKLRKLRKKFKWLGESELEFAPGFFGLVEEFLVSFDAFLTQHKVVNLEYFSIQMIDGALEIYPSWFWADSEQAAQGKSLVEATIRKTRSVCSVCGRPKPRYGQYDFQNNRCEMHFDAPFFSAKKNESKFDAVPSLAEISIEASMEI